LERAARHFDGWLPNAPDAKKWGELWKELQAAARNAGRDPGALTGAMYLTVAVDDDAGQADARLNDYLERYYNQPAAAMRARQACYAGTAEGLVDWLQGYVAAGASHLVVRFAGDHERLLGAVAAIRTRLG
jgi:alkanesulfonate monooxygenase SsuD/methylene tetrahydromethanopterin reductase-like flavin-dependent oxidoreductase (luciferase family)